MIRYFRFIGNDKRLYYAATEDFSYFMNELEIISKRQFPLAHMVANETGHFLEIFPDNELLEEEHINATDRPSVDDFKYPELGVW